MEYIKAHPLTIQDIQARYEKFTARVLTLLFLTAMLIAGTLAALLQRDLWSAAGALLFYCLCAGSFKDVFALMVQSWIKQENKRQEEAAIAAMKKHVEQGAVIVDIEDADVEDAEFDIEPTALPSTLRWPFDGTLSQPGGPA